MSEPSVDGRRRGLLAAGAAGAAGAAVPWAAAVDAPAAQQPQQQQQQRSAGAGSRTLRAALSFAETGFDPPRVSDQSSIRINAHIFEPPLTYDPLARPVRLMPLTAAALPEVSADFTRFVVTLQRGILFADDPAFGGRPRELVAEDYVYAIKRYYDPVLRSEYLYQFENAKILGLSELRREALDDKRPFDYAAPVAGLRALDRWRFEVRLAEPAPRFVYLFASTLMSAVAREVIERYAADPLAHPVGTGPFMLAQWRRGSRIVLVRNPRFREQRFETSGAPADMPHLQAAQARLAGARAPLLDRIEIDVIVEDQPRWLSFLNGDHDTLTLPKVFADLALPGAPGAPVAPFLQRLRVRAEPAPLPSTKHTFFNFDDPLVGGYTPAKVALRRAVALAYDSAEELRLVFRGQGVPAHGMIPPGCQGHDPQLVSEMGRPSPARASALLDLHGYADRDGDGFREQPDGSPLVLRMAFVASQRERAISELWLKRLSAVGLRVVFEVGPFSDLIKKALGGQLMIWGFTWSVDAPDGDFYLGLAYGPNAEQSNDARFKLLAFDRLYERQRVLPDGPERAALMRQATKTMLAYVPYITHFHPLDTELARSHVQGALSHPFNRDRWRWMDVQPAALPAPAAG